MVFRAYSVLQLEEQSNNFDIYGIGEEKIAEKKGFNVLKILFTTCSWDKKNNLTCFTTNL